MKIFIGWSGTKSKQLAKALYDWLPLVLQHVEPYMSEEMEKGTRWASDIANHVEQSSFGLFCLTRENIEAPWINFEAGAISKVISSSFVLPILLGVVPSDIRGPLAMFQSATPDKEQMLRVVRTINSASRDNNTLDESRLIRAFEGLWEPFASQMKSISESEPEAPQREEVTEQSAALEEILSSVRQQAQDTASVQSYIRQAIGQFERNNQQTLEEIRSIIKIERANLSIKDRMDRLKLLDRMEVVLNQVNKFAASAKPVAGLQLTSGLSMPPAAMYFSEEDFRKVIDSVVILRDSLSSVSLLRDERSIRS